MEAHAILVVDDEPASLRAVMRSLQSECRVLTTESPLEALAILQREPIAVLVSDQRMAEMSGTDLLARAAAVRSEVIRILLTGYTDTALLIAAINAGHVYSYVTKPWEPGELRLVVRRAMERFEVEADRRRLLGELQETCVKLQRESERQSRLLTLTAHELRTPVHLLSSALGFLRETTQGAEAAAWVDNACNAAEWLGRCVRQLHVTMRWQTSAPALNRQEVQAEQLLDRLLATFDAVARRRNLRLSSQAALPLPPLRCDEAWMVQAIAALLSNAVRFTPDGGSVEMRAWSTEESLCIAVCDSGIGIAPDLLDCVFEPFSPAGGEVAQHGSGGFDFGARGLGLGLAIAKAIVEAHGGCIEVQSQPGQGSCFTIRFPGPGADARERGGTGVLECVGKEVLGLLGERVSQCAGSPLRG